MTELEGQVLVLMRHYHTHIPGMRAVPRELARDPDAYVGHDGREVHWGESLTDPSGLIDAPEPAVRAALDALVAQGWVTKAMRGGSPTGGYAYQEKSR